MRLTYRVPEARSLKDKRRVANRIKDRVRARFEVSVAEVDQQDVHGTLVIGVALVSADARLLESTLDRITEHVDQLYVAERVGRQRSIRPFDADPQDFIEFTPMKY